jgi:hypothetical protein
VGHSDENLDSYEIAGNLKNFVIPVFIPNNINQSENSDGEAIEAT